MTFDQRQQKIILQWLKTQAKTQKKELHFSVVLGTFSGLLIIAQAWLLAWILHDLIINKAIFAQLVAVLLELVILILVRAAIQYWRDQINFRTGLQLRKTLRKQILDRLDQLGPAFIKEKNIGSWSTLLIEQIEDIQDFYSRYLPQMKLAMLIPIFIVLAISPINWPAALILCITAPLIPLFMAMVGMGAADINRKNFLALNRLSGHFLDRLKSLETIRLFNQGILQTQEIGATSERFRRKTLDVLRLAFLSSAVLEFFASVSIAIVAVYFGFSYLGELNFGSYHWGISLFAGFFVLILAPEFFQPLRDLGTFYHAKAQAVAAADAIYTFLHNKSNEIIPLSTQKIKLNSPIQTIIATDLVILTHTGKPLLGPLSFQIHAGQHIALIGKSGEGKTSLVNGLLGFLPYQGSLTVNGIELKDIDKITWHNQLSWIGQNPYLPAATLQENILLAHPKCNDTKLNNAIIQSYLHEFIPMLPQGIDTEIGEDAVRLSVGQAQRVAIARAFIKPSQLVILDEPTASLDNASRKIVNTALKAIYTGRTVITITHQHDSLEALDTLWQLEKNTLTITKVPL